MRWILQLLVLLSLLFLLADAAVAKDATFYQQGLSPAASRLLFTVQELSRDGKYRPALRKIEQFSQGRDRNLPILLGFVAANLNFQLGNYRQSVTLYRQVVGAAPEFTQAFANYGAALLQVGDYHEAVRILLQAAAMMPEQGSQLRYRAAVAALYGGDYQQARALLVALTTAPDGTSAPPADWLKALIQVDWQLSKPQQALPVAARLVDLYPAAIAHWRLYGQAAAAAGAWRKALSAYKVLQTEGQITVKERKLMAAFYQRLKLNAQAAEILARVYAESVPKAQELKQLAYLFRQAGQIELALRTMARLQKLYPDPMNNFKRGEILYTAGRYREASKIFLSLDKLPTEDGRQFILAGYCAWNLDDFSAAVGAWQRAAKYPAWQKQALKLLQSVKPLLKSRDS